MGARRRFGEQVSVSPSFIITIAFQADYFNEDILYILHALCLKTSCISSNDALQEIRVCNTNSNVREYGSPNASLTNQLLSYIHRRNPKQAMPCCNIRLEKSQEEPHSSIAPNFTTTLGHCLARFSKHRAHFRKLDSVSELGA